MADLIGHSIGRYHIVERLGEGGMAVVYKAFDTRLEREVAIKVIRMENFGTAVVEQMLKRFEREAKTLARLSHPNIVKIHDFGEHEGSPYLVMEVVPGGTLKQRTGTPMPWLEAVRLLLPVAHALSYAHEENVIHCNIKPANILLARQGHLMLSDFGVAKILDVDAGSTLTGTNVGIGTPEYLAPEQWMNEVSPQTDIYALGIVLFELVTGKKPYTADTPAAVLLKQASDPLPRPKAIIPGLPDEVEQVIFKALEKKPENRYADMSAFAVALERLGYGAQTTSATPEKAMEGGTVLYPAQVKENESAVRIAPPPSDRTVDEVKPGIALSEGHLVTGRMPTWGWGLVGFLGLGVMVAIVLLFGRTGQPRSAETSLANEIQTGAATTEPTFMPVDTSTPEASPTPELKMGSTMASEKDGMTLMYVPQGGFEMGSNDGDDDERPVHTVWLDAFWIDQTEVTNAMYAKCVADGLCKSSRCADNIDFIGAGQPVVGVDWNDANSYCEWGGRRLPTEAEWEKAARGMLGRSYPWGEGIDCDKANYGSCKWKTVEVGSYPDGASPYGALDMAGNAWEWVADWYGETYYLSSPDRAPSGPSIGDSRVLRGGSWGNDGVYVRFSCRLWGAPDRWNCYNGFRCAVSPSS